MRIEKIDINDISFNYCSYRKEMYDSIKRIGLSFPIKVYIEDGKYYCKDGHKRLSAIKDMINEDNYNIRRMVNIVVINNGNTRSNDCWRGRNSH